MPTPQLEPLRAITAAEQAALERIVSAGSERVDHVRRAVAILAVAQGKPFIRAAELAGLRSGTTVADLVKRFNCHGLAPSTTAAGRGPKPISQPHEYIRGGTAKLLTLFRPATGQVRAKGVTNAPNVVLHTWLKAELLQILAELPDS